MQISDVIKELETLRQEHGEIEVELQDSPKNGEPVTAFGSFFIVPEVYGEGSEAETVCNIRTWPY